MVNVDTLIEFRKLVHAGYTEAQAEAQVRLVADSSHQDMSGFATKADINHLEIVTKNDLKMVETRLEGEIKGVETRLEGKIERLANIVYLFGGAIFTTTCIPIIQKYLGY